MPEVKIYTTSWCPYCHRALALLRGKGVPFEQIDVDGNDAIRAWLREATGQRTVPQIFIGGSAVGGYTELAALDRRGELDRLLAAP